MASVIGIGGIFFKAKDPAALGEWYRKWLHVPVEAPYGASLPPEHMPKNGFTVWAPFDAGTEYFAPSTKDFMFNLVVDDLDGALAQAAEGGARIVGDIQEESYGRFGWFMDPEGNKVELWEPAKN